MASKDEKARVIEAGGAKITIQNEDPSNVFQLVEVLGSGSYGEVYKVFAGRGLCPDLFQGSIHQ